MRFTVTSPDQVVLIQPQRDRIPPFNGKAAGTKRKKKLDKPFHPWYNGCRKRGKLHRLLGLALLDGGGFGGKPIRV